jgi:hypothetical protein
MVIRLLVSAGVVAAFVWLDVRALHDIVAREPNLALEYFTVVLSGLAFGGVAQNVQQATLNHECPSVRCAASARATLHISPLTIPPI